MRRLITHTALLLAVAVTHAAAPFGDWPAGSDPATVGRRVAAEFVARPLEYTTNPKRAFVIYPEACAWYGALTTAGLIGDQALRAQLAEKFAPLLGAEANRISTNAHVDFRVIGIVPLELHRQLTNAAALALGRGLADAQWSAPTADGITAEARYWIDDLYMIPAVQVQAFRVTGDRVYLDRAARTMAAYLDRLQQPNGLFHHAPDVPFFWSRGNGWVAAGLAELLRDLPPGHPDHARILAGYRTMMEALLKYQGEDGRWRQLLDRPESWPESSGTGMFTFALITGVKQGWLDAATYGPAARRGWLALVAGLYADARLADVCEGTNKKNDYQYYLDRKRRVGDLHGQAPVLWCASALLR